MPMTKKSGKVRKSELPGTLQRSPKKAQRLFAKVHDAAASEYGEGRPARQAAYAALEHGFAKVGERWVKKPKSGSPARQSVASADGGPAAPRAVGPDSSKRQLMAVAQRLDVSGRSSMTKHELAEAIKKARRTAPGR